MKEDLAKKIIKIELKLGDVLTTVQALGLLKQIVSQTSDDDNADYPIVSIMIEFNNAIHNAGLCGGKDCGHKKNVEDFKKKYSEQISGDFMENLTDALNKLFKNNGRSSST